GSMVMSAAASGAGVPATPATSVGGTSGAEWSWVLSSFMVCAPSTTLPQTAPHVCAFLMAKVSFPYGLSLLFMSVVPGAWRRTAAGAGLLSSDGAVAPTIFAEMSAAAARTGAINLGQGFPDEDGPAE